MSPSPIKQVRSRQNPAVNRYRSLTRDRAHANGLLLLDGAALIEEALAAGLRLREAAVASGLLADPDTDRLVARLQARGVELSGVSDAVMAAMSPVRTPSGWVAIAERPRDGLDRVFHTAPALVVALIDVQDPGNVGAVIRAAEAGGATGVITSGGTADPFGWKALRGAMGSAFRVPIAPQVAVEDVIARARAHQIRLLATVPRGGTPHLTTDLTRPAMVLLGSEGTGLAPDVIRAADDTISIGMVDPVDSLNVAVAAGVLVFEARRQRRP